METFFISLFIFLAFFGLMGGSLYILRKASESKISWVQPTIICIVISIWFSLFAAACEMDRLNYLEKRGIHGTS